MSPYTSLVDLMVDNSLYFNETTKLQVLSTWCNLLVKVGESVLFRHLPPPSKTYLIHINGHMWYRL